MLKTISFLITVHNRKEKTLDCLRHLYAQNGLGKLFDISVFLTDDGCTDGTTEAVSSIFPDITIIKGDGQLYWNRGMYTAWTEAAKHNADYYCWLNDDTFLFPDCIEKLLEVSAQYSDQSIIIGSTCDSATKKVTTYGGCDKKGRLIMCPKENTECSYMNGNIVLIPVYVFAKVGYNDPHYHHSSGDTDYSIAARKNGIKLILAPGHSGICDLHPKKPAWKDPSCSLSVRWKDMMKPTGANPYEYFYFRKKNYGLLPACMTFVSNICHVLFPKLWK